MQPDDQVAGLRSAFIYRHMTALGRVLIPPFSLLYTDYYLDLLTFCWQSCTRLRWLINLKYGFWKIFILLLLWHAPAQSQLAFSSNANEEEKHCSGFKLVPATKNLSLPSSFSHQLQHIQTMEKSINPACFTAFNWTCIRKSVEAPPGETLTMLTWRKTFYFSLCEDKHFCFFSETESSHKESGGGPGGGPGGAPFICSGANHHSDSWGPGPVYCLDRFQCHFTVRHFYYWLYCWNLKSYEN